MVKARIDIPTVTPHIKRAQFGTHWRRTCTNIYQLAFSEVRIEKAFVVCVLRWMLSVLSLFTDDTSLVCCFRAFRLFLTVTIAPTEAKVAARLHHL